MAKINPAYQRLSAGYLFPEIARRTREFQAENPDAQILRLGIGDTTEALPQAAIDGMTDAVAKQGNPDTYSGYGDSEGIMPLREAIAGMYKDWSADVNVADIFVSDGAKSDSANIQSIFSTDAVVNGDFKTVSLSDYKGKWVYLFFYPLDFTFVCPSEILAFNRKVADFKEKGVELLGVSIDSHFSHFAWRNTPVEKGGIGEIDYPLVADVTKNIARDFGFSKRVCDPTPIGRLACRQSTRCGIFGIVRE